MKNIHKFVFSSILLSDAFSFNLLLSHINKQVWRAFHNPNLFSFLLNFLCVFFYGFAEVFRLFLVEMLACYSQIIGLSKGSRESSFLLCGMMRGGLFRDPIY